MRSKFLSTLIAVTLTFLGLPQVADASVERLEEALFNQTKEVHRSRLQSLNDGEIDDVADNIKDTAEDIDYDQDPTFGEHIEQTWRSGDGSRSHVRKCPYCNAAATRVAQGTPLAGNVPQLDVPGCLVVNGAYYTVGPRGELVRLNPMTGQVVGSPEGSIWFQGGQYYGVSFVGQPFPAGRNPGGRHADRGVRNPRRYRGNPRDPDTCVPPLHRRSRRYQWTRGCV